MSDPASRDHNNLSPTIVGQIELICDRFESAWRGEARPRIEDYWREADGPDLLRELLVLELAYRINGHDHPEPNDYHSRFAAHAKVIRAAFETIPARHPLPGPAREAIRHIADPAIDVGLSRLGDLNAPADGAEKGKAVHSFAERRSAERFHVLRPLARGGLGEVFVARDEELQREVALKLIQERHARDPGSRSRFQFEAEITGRLEHPGVIPVYGLGVGESGRPYYAMRFVRGDTLKESIERFHGKDGPTRDPGERSLAFRELLGRFVDVCNTMAYAHGRGILHRDLKPANVILGPYGETLVLDWGLAKVAGCPDGEHLATDGGLESLRASAGAATEPGSWLGTPAFMSPEQAAGRIDLIGPASDVYSLGATLYNLLTGKTAFGGADVFVLLGKIRAGDFPPPRSVEPTLEPALEAVCLTAMALTPTDRYASCRALADDIKRWMADEPVSAYRDPAPIRLARWCRRHLPLVVGLTATLVVAVMAMAIGTVLIGRQRSEALRQRDRAADNLAVARQVVDEMYTRAAILLADRNGMDADQRELLLKAARFYERFALPQSTDRAVRIEAGRAGIRAANILWKLGDTKQAEADYSKALGLLESMVSAAPHDAESRRALAQGCYEVSDFYRTTDRMAEAEATLRRSAELYKGLAAADPRAAADRMGITLSLIELGNIENDLGRYAEAEASFKQALALLEELVRDYSGVAPYRSAQARAWNCLADLERHLGRSVDAMSSWGRALAASEALARAHPDVEQYRGAVARAAHNLGTVQSEVGLGDKAAASYAKAAEFREALVRDHPDVPVYRYELAGTYNNRGNLLRDAGKPSEAQRAFEQAVAMHERLVLDHPSVGSYRRSLATSLTNLGLLFQQIGSPSSALPTLQRSVALQEDLVRDHPDTVDYREGLARALLGLASIERLAGKRDEAMRSLRRSVEFWESLPLAEPQHLYNLACAHAQYCGLIDGRRQPLLPEEKAERESHAERSITALRRAVASGFIPPSWISKDSDLDPLRSRDDFRALLMDLTFPAQPFASPPAKP